VRAEHAGEGAAQAAPVLVRVSVSTSVLGVWVIMGLVMLRLSVVLLHGIVVLAGGVPSPAATCDESAETFEVKGGHEGDRQADSDPACPSRGRQDG
jgi:hypothetical protein